MKTQNQKGFTLVELAIVMTIIGLLIGGILKGQELMENARVTSTIAQIRSYESATTTFRDTYSAMPGDMANAATRLPNCDATCGPNATDGIGDGIVGANGGVILAQNVVANATNNTADEAVLFWTHLLRADLISGISDAGIAAGGVVAAGETHPAAKIGGVFRAGHGDGAAAAAIGGVTVVSGTALALSSGPVGDLDDTLGSQAISPLRAAQIDRKMDDGKPATGFVIGYGAVNATDGCMTATTTAGVYIEQRQNKDCGMIFRIQG